MKQRRRDILTDPGFRRFAERWLKEVAPKISESAYTMAIAPTGGIADVKMAIEIGYTIMLDKPLIVFVPSGCASVAPKLLRIADHVIEGDMDTEAGREALQAKLMAVLNQ